MLTCLLTFSILTHVKVEELCNWIKSKCGFDDEAATMYAAAMLTHLAAAITQRLACRTAPTRYTHGIHAYYMAILPATRYQAHLLYGYTSHGYARHYTRYAEALVGEGVDQPSDLGDLEDGDWPSSIKPLHLKKLKAAAADV